jgi:hypothetical protein
MVYGRIVLYEGSSGLFLTGFLLRLYLTELINAD